MGKNRLILVTNDDGYQAKGINCLIKVVQEFGDVVIVAPENSQSGMSHSVSLGKPLFLRQIETGNAHLSYVCSGTPVDCIKIAIHKILNRKPDLIISGINHGSNSSVSAIYSGTIGAAREGSLNGVPSIGLSLLDHSDDANFEAALHYSRIIIKEALDKGMPERTCLNVNIPNIKQDEIAGIKICRQTKGKWMEAFEHRKNPSNKDYFWLTGEFNNYEPEAEDTDEWALNNNYVSIVPIEVQDYTNYDVLTQIKNWNL